MVAYKNKSKAITLIELITVIAIIGIVSSIGAGFLKLYQPTIRLYTETRALKGELARARAQTIAEQKIYGIRLVAETDQYEFVIIDGTTVALETSALPDEVSFQNIGAFTSNTIYFTKSGAANESGNLILENTNGDTQIITINPSGYIQIQ